MKTILKIILLVFVLYALSSYKSKISLIENNDFKEIVIKCDTIGFKISDFDIYVYNICERNKVRVNRTGRFCECPNNFFEKSYRTDSIKKVEETYLFINKKTNLVFYFTTFSHKHIYFNSGFLNDSCSYKNKMYVFDLEYIYIGTRDEEKNIFQFKSPCKDERKDIIWHYSTVKDTIKIDKVNIATAENKYTITKPISLDSVFSEKIQFKKADYKLFYKNDNKIPINSFFIIAKKGRVEILFKLDSPPNEYIMKKKKIPYHMNFEEISDVYCK